MLVGKGLHGLDEASAGVEASGAEACAHAEFRHFGVEEARDLDHRRVVLADGLDVKRHHDHAVVGGIDCARDGEFRIGHHVIGNAAQQDALAVPLPADDVVVRDFAAVAGIQRGLRDLADPEEILVELIDGDFVIDAVVNAMDEENAGARLCFGGDYFVVRGFGLGTLR